MDHDGPQAPHDATTCARAPTLQRALAGIGRHGAALLVASLIAGLLWPALAAALRPWLGFGVFVCTAGALVQIDRAAWGAELARRVVLGAVLLWALLAVPALAWLLLRGVALPADVEAGLLFYALAPPAAAAPALAALFGLNAALAMGVRVAACLFAPIGVPLLAHALAQVALPTSAWALAAPVAAVMLGAAALAHAARRLPCADPAARHAAAGGASVLGLMLMACGSMHGVAAQLAREPAAATLALASVLVLSLLLQLAGTLAFAPLGARDALTVGLLSGQRNVSLVWVALAPWLADDSPLARFFALSMLPSFALPLLMQAALRLRRHPLPSNRPTPGRVPVACATSSTAKELP